jgi:hypothetical protein
MYNVNVPFTTGNFDLDINIQLKDEVVEKFVKNGAIYVVQRDGASKAYLSLKGEENDKGKLVLPKDFERKSVEFSQENLQAMIDAFSKALAPYGEAVITGSEHVSGAEVSPMKRATEFVDSLLGNAQNEATLRQFLSMYDATASDADRDGLIKIANDNGVGKAKPKA